VWAVRDATSKKVRPDDEAKGVAQAAGALETDVAPEWIEEVVDPGAEDKRLLVVESEFSQALKTMARAGNTLSPVLRSLWDGGSGGMLTKHSPSKATGAHVSIIGHIVRDELRRELTGTEMANGFANRFLFCCAKRSKLLPEGGSLATSRYQRSASPSRWPSPGLATWAPTPYSSGTRRRASSGTRCTRTCPTARRA
jgi:hypothetical protein